MDVYIVSMYTHGMVCEANLAEKGVMVVPPHIRVCCDGEGVSGEGEERGGRRIHYEAAAIPLTQQATHIV